MTTYVGAHERRRLAVQLAGLLNGIDHLEVRDTDEAVPALRQRTLHVRLLQPVPASLDGGHVVVDGGERIRTVAVEWASAATALPAVVPATEQAALLDGLDEPDHVLVVRTAERGDFSRYRLALVAAPGSSAPPPGFDPLLTEVGFSFKVECPADLDCRARCTCPSGVRHRPPIDYLAKDYQGFRRLLLERMALLVPGWTGRHAADVGVAVAEVLAYVADELSYRQDAVATEAYLGTARSRVSLRRHARLVDYRVHDGCNARAWVRVRVSEPTVVLPAGTTLLSQVPGLPTTLEPDTPDHETARAASPVVFETVDEAVLHADLEELRFWTWGDPESCLPAGATEATLRGWRPRLRAGDVLVLAETLSPTTGSAADADPTRRWPVRVVEARSTVDPSGALFPDGATQVTRVRWHADDALPFPLCLTHDGLEPARAWGNVVLADHGATVTAPEDRDLGTVPRPTMTRVGRGCGDDVGDDVLVVWPRYRPELPRGPLTQRVAQPAPVVVEVPLTPALSAELVSGSSGDELQAVLALRGLPLPDGSVVRGTSPLWSVHGGGRAWQLRERLGALQVLAEAPAATGATLPVPRAATPALTVHDPASPAPATWTPVPDLLGSPRTARHLTVEIEHDHTARLRFGDDEHGLRPAPGTAFVAAYRVGNGAAGNVGRDGLHHVVTTVDGIVGVGNPLPATGGVEPETGEEIRRDAPAAFLVQERAVTEADHAEVAERSPEVERAAATFRWTGSWHTAFVTAERLGNAPVDAGFESRLRAGLERYRMAGYDLEVDGPVFVPLQLGLHVCVLPGYFRADVAVAVREVLSARDLPDGRRGLFHPDRLSLGQPVHLSPVLAAVHAVTGVQSVEVRTFARQREPGSSGVADGVLPMGRLEVARLDDDPSFPERGVLDLTLGGGA